MMLSSYQNTSSCHLTQKQELLHFYQKKGLLLFKTKKAAFVYLRSEVFSFIIKIWMEFLFHRKNSCHFCFINKQKKKLTFFTLLTAGKNEGWMVCTPFDSY